MICVIPYLTLISSLDVEYPTFLEMWKLSEPGGEAEHCFMRVPQTEYFDSLHSTPSPMDRMPAASDCTDFGT